jgi:hypothetical protein
VTVTITTRNTLAAIAAVFISSFSNGTLYAGPLSFGVVGSPIDLSANVKESLLPGTTIFQDSRPLFGTLPDPVQSAELLHLSTKGVNGSGRSTIISSAFASSLANRTATAGLA